MVQLAELTQSKTVNNSDWGKVNTTMYPKRYKNLSVVHLVGINETPVAVWMFASTKLEGNDSGTGASASE